MLINSVIFQEFNTNKKIKVTQSFTDQITFYLFLFSQTRIDSFIVTLTYSTYQTACYKQTVIHTSRKLSFLVPETGIEPARAHGPTTFKVVLDTNFNTPASFFFSHY